jgi:uncharacterized membrane protein YGL010W
MVQYAHHHRDRRNIATHLLGFSLIILTIGVLMLGPSWSLAGQTLTLSLASLARTGGGV